MSLSADPMFVAAEVQWRRESLAAGFPMATARHHHRAAIRAALSAVAHPHRHGAPRVA